ncbi:lysoplasmalogenase family protein [Vibrio sp. PP-XX7]
MDWLFTVDKHHRLCFFMFWFTGIAFGIAFWYRVTYPVHLWLLMSILAIGIILFLLALPHIEKRLVPVGIIGMTMTAFVWAACEWWLQRHSWAACSGMLGAILFSLVTFRVMVSSVRPTLTVTSLWVIGMFQLPLFCIVGSCIVGSVLY